MKTVSPEDAERWVLTVSDEHKAEVLASLSSFGTLLLSEANGRISALDAKATSTLGWSAAALAFFVAGTPDWISTNSWIVVLLTMVGIGTGLAGVVLSWLALRPRHWKWPSQEVWFDNELFDNPARLKAQHVKAMLVTHRDCLTKNAGKAQQLSWAQLALFVTALLVGGMALDRVVRLFLRSLI
jgi:hypothetical protein